MEIANQTKDSKYNSINLGKDFKTSNQKPQMAFFSGSRSRLKEYLEPQDKSSKQ